MRLPQPQNSFHLRQTTFLVQLLERGVARLVQRLKRRFPFLFGCCCACLGCFALHRGGVGCFAGRLPSGVGGFAFLVLAGYRELLRHSFGGFSFDPCPLSFWCLACLPGSLCLCSGLPVAFDLMRGIRPATRGGFPELLDLPEFLGSLLRPHDLADLRQPFPRPVGPLQLVRADQLQLLGYQRSAELHCTEGVSAGNDHVLKLVAEVAGHSL